MTEKTEYTVTGLTQNDTMQCGGDVSDRHNHNGSNMVKQRVTQEAAYMTTLVCLQVCSNEIRGLHAVTEGCDDMVRD